MDLNLLLAPYVAKQQTERTILFDMEKFIATKNNLIAKIVLMQLKLVEKISLIKLS